MRSNGMQMNWPNEPSKSVLKCVHKQATVPNDSGKLDSPLSEAQAAHEFICNNNKDNSSKLAHELGTQQERPQQQSAASYSACVCLCNLVAIMSPLGVCLSLSNSFAHFGLTGCLGKQLDGDQNSCAQVRERMKRQKAGEIEIAHHVLVKENWLASLLSPLRTGHKLSKGELYEKDIDCKRGHKSGPPSAPSNAAQ